MSEKELEEYLSKLVEKQVAVKYGLAEQSQKIAKDLKNGRDKISVKDILMVVGTVLAMLTVIYYSAQANTTAETTKVSLTSHECVDSERTINIEKRLDRIETKVDQIIRQGGKE